MLSGGGALPWNMTNAVIERFGPVTVIEEDREPRAVMIRRRMRLLGPVAAAGQVAFTPVLLLLQRLGAARKAEIVAEAGLDAEPSRNCTLVRVPSVNSEACREALAAAAPKVILVFGTRMIRARTLACVDALFINYHAGINPLYRGMNGGYWALARGDAANAGVTVHLVDKGVDTGGILYTAPFEAGPRDTFVTYPYLQAAAGRGLVIRAAEDALAGHLTTHRSDFPSRQWFHPTLWQYLWAGLTRGVW